MQPDARPAKQPSSPSTSGPLLRAPRLARRMACWLYEGMLMFGVVFMAGYLYSALSQTRHGLDNRHGLQLFLFIIFGIYFTWFWHKGQTLAMKTWHIRIVTSNGQPLSQGRAMLRYVCSWLWFLPPLVVSVPFGLPVREILVLLTGWIALWALSSRLHPQGQFWHDALAGTRLVTAQRPAPTPPALPSESV